jgi:hypothetical protein
MDKPFFVVIYTSYIPEKGLDTPLDSSKAPVFAVTFAHFGVPLAARLSDMIFGHSKADLGYLW